MILLTIAVMLALGSLIDTFFWKIVRIDGQTFIARLPIGTAGYQKGLGGRENLCRSCAMLFNFSRKGEYAFWMKGMNFNLDILWIADGKIVYIKNDFAKDSSEIVEPDVPIDAVLEIGAGISEKNGFRVGDAVAIY